MKKTILKKSVIKIYPKVKKKLLILLNLKKVVIFQESLAQDQLV